MLLAGCLFLFWKDLIQRIDLKSFTSHIFVISNTFDVFLNVARSKIRWRRLKAPPVHN